MRILVLGGYGLIGSHVATRLVEDGHAVVGLGRDIAAARRRFPTIEWIERDLRAMTRARDWAPLLVGVDAVVNCAGALQDNARDDLAAVHIGGPLALAEACVTAGARRFVHISAIGADADRAEPFSATKYAFERRLAALDLDWIILRPALVWSPQAYGGTALLRGLAAFPIAIPHVYGASRIQIVGAEDVAEAVARALAPDAPVCASCDLAHPEPLELRDILLHIRSWLGLPPARLLALPPVLARLIGALADALAWLGWRSPMRSAALDQLRAGVVGDGEAAQRIFGFTPKSFEALLLRHPAGVQERWFARAYFIKPLALTVLSLFWIASGVIGFARAETAATVLTSAGWSAGAASATVIVGAIVDMALGFGAPFRSYARFALLGMIAVSLGYLAAATLVRPDLWLDPLGPLVKVLPGAALALAALAMLDER
jgi:uncharacterized protein YbjT (DUF2867 family)